MLVRKTVTVLFCDVVTSSEYSERIDPESWRRVMSRFFEEMQAVIERHGGTVEKFIGDEVMAVFGVPAVHEDDAMRAVRAAAEMRDRLALLNDELEAAWGMRLQTRMGVNTGEVVAGDPATGSTFVTGDAVNLGKRLQQAAGPDEILIGKATYPLVRNAIRAGPLESFPVKGKAQPVAPWRLDDVATGVPGLARRLDAPLVGRRSELGLLSDAFAKVAAERSCGLVTVLGPAGVGKSRLAAELVASVGDRARALTGRCLPYGEGITFWPLADIIREAGGDSALAQALKGVDDADAIAEHVRAAIGESPTSARSEETFWAIRRFLEASAAERPLIVVLDDLHWAEPTFLDLVEYVAGWSRTAPVLLLCLARRELLDRQPAWVAPRENATVLSLEPLSNTESHELLGTLDDGEGLSASARDRIAAAAEGNPLFLEQLVAMAIEEGGANGSVRVPPSIQALLAERLDRLNAGERAVVERAAVIGKDFRRSAVASLCPPELAPEVGTQLMALMRKELVRPDTTVSTRDDGFRFRHVLIQDAAYAGLPKEVRAELHERYAVWLANREGLTATELEEIVGYHLERAYQNRIDLAPLDDSAVGLGRRAAMHLGAAGHRALGRGDISAALNLLDRAIRVVPEDDVLLVELLLDYAGALREAGDFQQAETVVDRALSAARALDDERLACRAEIERVRVLGNVDPQRASTDLPEIVKRAIPIFTESGDDLGLAKAWSRLGELDWARCRVGPMEDVLERALIHADRAGDRREVSEVLVALARAALVGPRPVEAAIERCSALRRRASGDLTLTATIDSLVAVLEAMRGESLEARRLSRRSSKTFDELGLKAHLAALQMYSGLAEMIAGHIDRAERDFRRGYEALERMGERSWLSTTAALLGRALWEQGRSEEAGRMSEISERTAADNDFVSHVVWRGTRAKVLAARSEDGAERLAREAVELAQQTDFVNMQGDSLTDLADVLCLLGREDEASPVLAEARRIYETKGNEASAERTERRLAQLGASRPA